MCVTDVTSTNEARLREKTCVVIKRILNTLTYWSALTADSIIMASNEQLERIRNSPTVHRGILYPVYCQGIAYPGTKYPGGPPGNMLSLLLIQHVIGIITIPVIQLSRQLVAINKCTNKTDLIWQSNWSYVWQGGENTCNNVVQNYIMKWSNSLTLVTLRGPCCLWLLATSEMQLYYKWNTAVFVSWWRSRDEGRLPSTGS